MESTWEEKAILNYVKNGGGFVPIHCASYCFRNSEEMVKLIGGQFWTHTMDSIRIINKNPNHEILKNTERVLDDLWNRCCSLSNKTSP